METLRGDTEVFVGDVETLGRGEVAILGEDDTTKLSEIVVETPGGDTVIIADEDDTGCEISSRVRLRLLAP